MNSKLKTTHSLLLTLMCYFTLSTSVFADDGPTYPPFPRPEKGYFHQGHLYQQQEYSIDDEEGDLNLALAFNEFMDSMKYLFTGKVSSINKELQEEVEYRKNDIFGKNNTVEKSPILFKSGDEPISLDGDKKSIRVNLFSSMLKQVIWEEYHRNGITPSQGSVHEWSPEFIQKNGKYFPFTTTLYSKLLICLSLGVTSKYMVTGTENALIDEILKMPFQSIYPDWMFRKSYQLNKGDIYLTLLTIENVLSQNWRNPERDKLAVTQRLADITNYNYQSDKYGPWYHLWGIMFYGYLEGAFKAKFAAWVEHIGSQVLYNFQDETQEKNTNFSGAIIGGELKKIIKEKLYFKSTPNPLFTDPSTYLNLKEDMRPKLEKYKKENNIR